MKQSDVEVSYIQHCGSDLSVVNAARVSFAKESDLEVVGETEEIFFETRTLTYVPKFKLSEKDAKLIKYLASHNHISPFHHAFVTLRVKAPMFVARQLVKHKFMPWNEVSRRYVDNEPEFWFPKEWHGRPVNAKQGASSMPIDIKDYFPQAAVEQSLRTYNSMLADGVAPEEARIVLPLNTMTEWYWSGTLSAWASMFQLRLKPDTQGITREVAQLCYDKIKPLFPVSLENLIAT